METNGRASGLGFKLIRGLSSFEARAIALIVLLFIVFPTLSRADAEEPVTVDIVSTDYTVRGGGLELTVLLNGTAENVSMRWLLPGGFQLANGTLVDFCESLGCNRTIDVFVNESVAPGIYQIGVEVDHA
jgi:hypothetical protein